MVHCLIARFEHQRISAQSINYYLLAVHINMLLLFVPIFECSTCSYVLKSDIVR